MIWIFIHTRERCKEQDAQGYGLLFDVDGNISMDSAEIPNREEVQSKVEEDGEMRIKSESRRN